MLNYTYNCIKCHEILDVMSFGGEVIVNDDFEHPLKELEDVKCPKCGGEVCCTYDPRFDDYE